jgi:hydroxymethylbilane synthase
VVTLRVGTRTSALASWQTECVLALWRAAEPSLSLEIVPFTSVGDEHPEAPLERMEGTGFFSSTLERAVLEGVIDIAVHSYKDLPVAETLGLTVACIPSRGPVEDALCARDGLRLRDLPPGARVGTSSLRRIAQLRALRSDLEYVPLRGNVPTRLARVERGEMDAVLLARAGIERLGLGARATEVFAPAVLLPAPAQGALAVQTRTGARRLTARLAGLDHAPTRRAVEAERALLHALHGGCSVPVGAFAEVERDRIRLEAGVFALEGSPAFRVTSEGDSPQATGAAAARALLERGAGRVLEALARTPRLAIEARP